MSHEADGAISHGPALDDADRLMLAIGAGGLDVAVAMGGGPFYLQCPKVLGVKQATVKTRLHRGRLLLRAALLAQENGLVPGLLEKLKGILLQRLP